jgi:hypothetical protein
VAAELLLNVVDEISSDLSAEPEVSDVFPAPFFGVKLTE